MYRGNYLFLRKNNLRIIKEEMAIVCILFIHDPDLHYCCKTLPRNYDLGLRAILFPCLGIRQLDTNVSAGKQFNLRLLLRLL